MLLETSNAGNVFIARVVPRRLDARIAVDFKEQMKSHVDAGDTTIVLDLSSVDFIDSSGLGAIVSSLKAIGRTGDLVIAGVRDTVMPMFQLTRMNKVFRMYGTTDEAVAALNQ